MSIYGAFLFFLFSPGVLFRFPSTNPMIVLGVHAVLFGIIWQITHKAVYRQIYGKEGFMSDGEKIGIAVGSAVGVGILILIIVARIIIQNLARAKSAQAAHNAHASQIQRAEYVRTHP